MGCRSESFRHGCSHTWAGLTSGLIKRPGWCGVAVVLLSVGASGQVSLGGGSVAHRPIFGDVTVRAGLDTEQYVITDPPDPRGLIYMSGGAAIGDYDADGHPDLYVTRFDTPHALQRNTGTGTFTDVTESVGLGALTTGNGAAWGDVDNDGDLDLYVTAIFDTRFYLFINDGEGQFSEEGVSRGAAVEGPDIHFGQSVCFGDYDLDGYLDLHVCEWRRNDLNPLMAPSNSRLLRNLGALEPGHFEDTTVAAGLDLSGVHFTGAVFSFASTFTDLDQDGWPDLAITGDFGTSRLFWNDHDGSFTDGTLAAGVGTDENGMGSALGDYDGDGRLDWFVTSIYDPPCEFMPCGWGYTGNRLFRNLGGRLFEDATDAAGVRDGSWGWGAAFFDYDNDGDLDLAQTNGIDFAEDPKDEMFNDDPMRFWVNLGAGSMAESANRLGITDTGNGKGLVYLDYDTDGDVDLFVCNNSAVPVLYANRSKKNNGWLRVETVGLSGSQGIGARITVQVDIDGPTQVREVTCGSHFLGQSETVAHFGLGPGDNRVNEVSVYWPVSGTLQVMSPVARNQLLVVQEPEAPLTLSINGQRELGTGVVIASDQVTVTLDVTPSSFSDPVHLYVGTMIGHSSITWATPRGPQSEAQPLLTSALTAASGLTLFSGQLPAGTLLTTFVVISDGRRILARDVQSVRVPGSADPAQFDGLDPTDALNAFASDLARLPCVPAEAASFPSLPLRFPLGP